MTSYLVPVFLYTALGTLGKRLIERHVLAKLLKVVACTRYVEPSSTTELYLCNLAPAVPSVSHLLQSQLLSRCPRRVGATFFDPWLLRQSISLSLWRSGAARVRFGTSC